MDRFVTVIRHILLSTLLLAVPLAAFGAGQVSFPSRPPSGSCVSDEAGLLAPEDREEIERLGAGLLKEGYPISVVTIPSLAARNAGGRPIEKFAAETLNAWNLDADRRGYGMLLLVAADDHLARIELGSAWGRAHDGRVREVMDTLILPAFRRGEFSQGIRDGVRGLDAMGRGQALPTPPQPWWLIPAVAAGGLALVGSVISLGRSGRRGWAWAITGIVGGILLSRAIAMARGDDSGGSDDSGVTGKW